MSKHVNAPRGMRDFLPIEKAQRERALSIIRSVYRDHGFDEIEAPALENFDRLHTGLGGDNEKLSFSVLKRGLTGEDLKLAATPEELADLGLRFDLTVPLARYYASHHAELPSVFRAVHIGPVWRAERPQKGRYRQFVQADIDIIGEDTNLAEAELITATSDALYRLGLSDCVIRLNDRRILTSVLTQSGFEPDDFDRALIIIDKLDKIGVEGVTKELAELNQSAAASLGAELAKLDPEGVELTEAAMREVLPSEVDSEPIGQLAELAQSILEDLPRGVTLVFDPTLVRGMGYYTGTIFEIAHPGSGSSVGGGGRYDGMIGRFLSQSVPAVGFSLGFERIVDLLDFEDDEPRPAVAVIWDAKTEKAELMRTKRELINEGFRVQLVQRRKNMKAVFARLQEERFTHVLPAGESLREL
jgi:histidyl-tRNA synthetase